MPGRSSTCTRSGISPGRASALSSGIPVYETQRALKYSMVWSGRVIQTICGIASARRRSRASLITLPPVDGAIATAAGATPTEPGASLVGAPPATHGQRTLLAARRLPDRAGNRLQLVGCISPECCGFFAHRHGTCLNRRMEPSMESRSELRSEENAGAVGDRPARPEVDSLLARAGTRPPSNEVRASLAAIQAARAAAELRLQRDSLRVRVLTMAILAVVAAGTFALAGHLRARRRAAAAARAAA